MSFRAPLPASQRSGARPQGPCGSRKAPSPDPTPSCHARTTSLAHRRRRSQDPRPTGGSSPDRRWPPPRQLRGPRPCRGLRQAHHGFGATRLAGRPPASVRSPVRHWQPKAPLRCPPQWPESSKADCGFRQEGPQVRQSAPDSPPDHPVNWQHRLPVRRQGSGSCPGRPVFPPTGFPGQPTTPGWCHVRGGQLREESGVPQSRRPWIRHRHGRWRAATQVPRPSGGMIPGPPGFRKGDQGLRSGTVGSLRNQP